MSKDDICVVVSGGLDSYIAYQYALNIEDENGKSPNIIPLFVNYGQPYLQKELEAVQQLYSKDKIVHVTADCAHPWLNNVPTVNQQEVAGRNLLLAYYGALLAPRIWMVALETEMNVDAVRDKQPEFFTLTSGLLTFLLKNRQFQTIVETPFGDFTKTEEVALALQIGLTPSELMNTVSCYDPNHRNCGKCSTCYKRWIAMTNNNIEEEYAHDPWTSQYARSINSEMRHCAGTNLYPRFSKKRQVETHNALIKSGLEGILLTTSKVFIDSNDQIQPFTLESAYE